MAQLQVKGGTKVPEIRKGDTVVVLTGKDAGKRGVVDRVLRNPQGMAKTKARGGGAWKHITPLSEAAVVVEGLNIAKRHTKPRPKQGRTERQPRIQQGGILDVPQPILASKVMVICPHCSQPTRVKHGIAGDGRSVRLCTNCGETLTGELRKETRKK